MGSQVLLGLTRPKLDAPERPRWNTLHAHLGRLTILCAWATVTIGVYMAHTSAVYQVRPQL